MTNKKNKTIAFFSHWYFPEKIGCSTRVDNYCASLSKEFTVDLVCPTPAFPFGSFKKKIFIKPKVEQNQNDFSVVRLFNYVPGLREYTIKRYINFLLFPVMAILYLMRRRKKYDFLITTSPPLFVALIGYFGKVFFGKKWIYDVRDTWIENAINLGFLRRNSLIHKLVTIFEKSVFEKCDAIVFFTETVKEHFIEKYENVDIEKKSFVLYNGVDTQFFKPTVSWKKKPHQILYHGNIGTAQDLLPFIKTVEQINEKNKVRFYLYGQGDVKDELKKYVSRHDLKNTIIFKDPVNVEKIPGIINDSRIGIVSLKQNKDLDYTVPTKLLEFMACGVPVLSSDLKEISKIVQSSKSGYVTDNNVKDIKNKLEKMLSDEKTSIEMGSSGRKYILNHFNWNINIQPLLRFLERL